MAKSNAKSSKSNKTAHVLNLLTEPGEAPAQAGRAPHSEAPAPAPVDNSAEVAATIRSALEEDLLAELGEEAAQPEPAPQPEPTPEPAPAPQPEPEPTPEPAPAPQPEPEPTPEPAPAPQPEPTPEPAPAPKPAPDSTQTTPKENGITYVNVMQALVEDKVDKYMERFNMCRCSRCRTDVIALTLTSLPAKYVVIPENEGVPMLTIYEGRFSAAVTAQIMSACQKVAEHPRHSSQDDGSLRLGAPRNDS